MEMAKSVCHGTSKNLARKQSREAAAIFDKIARQNKTENCLFTAQMNCICLRCVNEVESDNM